MCSGVLCTSQVKVNVETFCCETTGGETSTLTVQPSTWVSRSTLPSRLKPTIISREPPADSQASRCKRTATRTGISLSSVLFNTFHTAPALPRPDTSTKPWLHSNIKGQANQRLPEKMAPISTYDGVKSSRSLHPQRRSSISSTSSSSSVEPPASCPPLIDTDPVLSPWESASTVNSMGQKQRAPWAEQQIKQSPPWASSGRPLVDFVENGWQTDPSPEILPVKSRWTVMFRSQRFRRYTATYLVLLAVCWLGWRWISQRVENAGLSRDLDGSSKTGRYGTNARPVFADMVHIKALDSKLVPKVGKGSRVGIDGERRLVVVGDVHGCKEERMCPAQALGPCSL